MFLDFYKGRTSINEIINMPHRFFYNLYIKIIQDSLTDEGKKKIAGEKIQETIEEGLT